MTHRRRVRSSRRRLPDWLLGLLIAVVLTLLILWGLGLLGVGDDPVIGAMWRPSPGPGT